ncbi:MAG: uncharacterized protein JWM90_2360 [Thermoleophilia bacterium]|nr:uncharacterized protein [Thermoleophilia bacterium]
MGAVFLLVVNLVAVEIFWREIVGAIRRRRDDVEEVVHAALNAIIRDAGITWDTAGLHVFVVRRIGPRQAVVKWGWKGLGRVGDRYLKRVATFRHADVLPSSGVVWTKAKGVVGVCWERNGVYGRDVATDFGDPKEWTRETWGDEPLEERDGLDWDDFRRVSRREYGGVLAFPIQGEHDRFVGCVSLDVPADDFQHVLDDDRQENDLRARNEVLSAMKSVADYGWSRRVHRRVPLPWASGGSS